MKFYCHVFSKQGDFYVSDSNAGDDVLYQVARDDPSATVIIKDRDTDEVVISEQLLSEYLKEQ